jgi:hypothetical protein
MNTPQAAQAELDRFFGPRQVNRNLIRDALAGASHIFVHTYDDHRVMVKKRGCRVDRPLSRVVQEECQRLQPGGIPRVGGGDWLVRVGDSSTPLGCALFRSE